MKPVKRTYYFIPGWDDGGPDCRPDMIVYCENRYDLELLVGGFDEGLPLGDRKYYGRCAAIGADYHRISRKEAIARAKELNLLIVPWRIVRNYADIYGMTLTPWDFDPPSHFTPNSEGWIVSNRMVIRQPEYVA